MNDVFANCRLFNAVIPAQAGIQQAVGRILESDISNSGFSETTDASNVFVGYKYPTYIWIPACEGMTAEISTKIASPVFRRLFASSVYIVTWALPTTMTAKRGRLKFWVWFVGKAHATGFRRLTLFDFVFTHLKTHFHAASCG